VDPIAYQGPTISKMVALFDNYIWNASVTEFVTPEELIEENDFLDAVFATPVMQRAQAFLEENGFPSGRSYISRIWFGLFNRGGGYLSSTGFEHVFAGELYSNGVQGLHNWVFYSLEEASGNLTSGTVPNFLDLGGVSIFV
jgi:poly(U)-specific endoribonuclease